MGASMGVDQLTKAARCYSRSIDDSAPWRSRIRLLSRGGVEVIYLSVISINTLIENFTFQNPAAEVFVDRFKQDGHMGLELRRFLHRHGAGHRHRIGVQMWYISRTCDLLDLLR